MTSSAKSPYTGYRFPGEIISHAVWLYFRFPLSLRMVEEMLAARGIDVSHETVRQRLPLRVHLGQIDAIGALDRELSERLEPFREAVTRLSATPGLATLSVAGILAEVGVDMHPFPSAAHLISWAGLCPRGDESTGKCRSTRLRPGAPWLKTLLVQAAWCTVRTKGSYFRALFLRLKARRGPKKAIVAVARAILMAVYVMLRRGVDYHDLGPDHFQRTERTRLATRLARRLDELGFNVTLTERPTA
jgi:transposase